MLGKFLTKAAAGNAGAEKDEYFNQTTLLLHGDGNQGATNFSNAGPPTYLAFKDNSDNNFPITVNGDAYGTTFGPFAVGSKEWSVDTTPFDANGSYLRATTTAEWGASTDFTIEMWVNFNVASAYYGLARGASWAIIGNNNRLSLTDQASTYQFLISWTPTVGQWHHIAVVRNTTASTLRLYVDGVDIGGGSVNLGGNLPNESTYVDIGVGKDEVVRTFNGKISNFRYALSAVYSGNFTPSTTPLTEVTNTKVLTCQSNRFVDNSSNNLTLAITGTPKVNINNPFSTLDGVNGAGYFDGNDTLQIAASTGSWADFGTGDFTIEAWVYVSAVSGFQGICGAHTGGQTNTWQFRLNGATLELFGASAQAAASTTSVVANQWNFVTASRSGANVYLGVNGSVNTVALTAGVGGLFSATSGGNVSIANLYSTPSNYWLTGYISNLRIRKGTADYTSSFTPSTSPLTAITNTELLTTQYVGTVRNVGFIDSSPNNFPITRVGNTTQGTFSPFSVEEGRWSNFFAGTGSGGYLTLPSSSEFTFGTGDFTIECFAFINGTGTGIFQQGTSIFPQTTVNSVGLATTGGPTNPRFYIYAKNTVTYSTFNWAYCNWYHLALVRSSGTTTLYANGTAIITVASDTTNYTGTYFGIGSLYGTGTSERFSGNISNLRVVKGTALYTGSFTPPSSPLTAISGTSLLTCQSNRYKDNSANAFAITVTGNTSVQPLSPFSPSAAYDPAVNGGSGYFDGSGDYLTVPYNGALTMPAGTDFCIEAWVYKTVDGATETIIGSYPGATSGNWLFRINSSNKLNLYVYPNNTIANAVSTTSITANEWFHVAVTREGTDYRLFVNGVLESTVTTTQNVGNANSIYIGRHQTATANDFSGYISNLRMVVGSAVYTSSFTPSTTPLTAVLGTSLLLNFTNAGILDSTGKNVLETVANAQVDTSVVKYGTGSMKFDGTGDRVSSVPSPNAIFGTGDFTIECWVYVSSFPASSTPIVSNWAGVNPSWILRFSTASGNVGFTDNSTSFLSSSSAISLSTWTHIAVARSGTSLKMFFDGVEVASATNSTSLGTAATGIHVGAYFNDTYPLTGYVDDLRITKGVARYTANFTPPDAPFLDQ